MIKKRIIGVITVFEKIAVQSFGYTKRLPLGDVAHLAENLDRWAVDEILVQSIDRSKHNLGPNFKLIEQLGNIGLRTPLIYGGGIRNSDDAVKVISKGADRIVCDHLFRNNPKEILKISKQLGRQCVIGSLPVRAFNEKLFTYDYITRKEKPLTPSVLNLIQDQTISELLLIDYLNEGFSGQFDKKILSYVDELKTDLILFGGIGGSDQVIDLVSNNNVSAVAIGNHLNYREDGVHLIKKSLPSQMFRRE